MIEHGGARVARAHAMFDHTATTKGNMMEDYSHWHMAVLINGIGCEGRPVGAETHGDVAPPMMIGHMRVELDEPEPVTTRNLAKLLHRIADAMEAHLSIEQAVNEAFKEMGH